MTIHGQIWIKISRSLEEFFGKISTNFVLEIVKSQAKVMYKIVQNLELYWNFMEIMKTICGMVEKKSCKFWWKLCVEILVRYNLKKNYLFFLEIFGKYFKKF